jgi:hypothetical protein
LLVRLILLLHAEYVLSTKQLVDVKVSLG